MTLDHLRRRILMALGVIGVLLSTVGAGAQDPPPHGESLPPRSLVEKWLDPQTVIAAALVMLYVGELRGDVKRIKQRVFVQLSDERLRTDFMPREVLDEKFNAIDDRLSHRRGEN